jgi:hypothetical protein
MSVIAPGTGAPRRSAGELDRAGRLLWPIVELHRKFWRRARNGSGRPNTPGVTFRVKSGYSPELQTIENPLIRMPMARQNYAFAKRQREIAKKQKKEEKRAQKAAQSGAQAGEPGDEPRPPPQAEE